MFRKVTIPLTKGQNDDESELSVVAPSSDLISATNVVFSRGGSVRGRPGTVSQDAAVVAYDSLSTGSSLSTPLGIYQVAGLHTDSRGALLLQCHGRMFRQVEGQWIDVGPMWSVRRKSYAPVGNFLLNDLGNSQDTGTAGYAFNYAAALDMGNNLASAVVAGLGFAKFGTDGSLKGPLNSASSLNQTKDQTGAGISVANNAVFWLDTTALNKLNVTIATSPYPTVINAQLATDAMTTAFTKGSGTTVDNIQRLWAAWDGTNYYVAYATGTTGKTTVLKVSTAGAVVGSLSYTHGATIQSNVSLAVDAASNKGVLFSAGPSGPTSEVFTLSTMTDLALSDFLPAAAYHPVNYAVGIGAGKAWLAYSASTINASGIGIAELYSRPLTAASHTYLAQYNQGINANQVYNLADASYAASAWQILFPPTVLAGRVLMGVQYSTRAFIYTDTTLGPLYVTAPYTWVVVDITDCSASVRPIVVAAGPTGGTTMVSRVSVATVINGSLLFGVPEGISFTSDSIDSAVLQPVQLTPQRAPSAASGPNLVLGGNVTYMYDGVRSYEAGWIQGAPVMTAAWNATVGSFTTGTYTLQAIWTYTTASGEIMRSLPSLPITVTVASGSRTITGVVSLPILTSRLPFAGGNVTASGVELYCTQVNPTNTAPLFLLKSITLDYTVITQGQQAFSLTFPPPNATTLPELYTTGNILGDERAPSDRGIAVSDNRIWTADERTLYPSFLRTNNVAPAWNLELYPIYLPEAYGSVCGIAAVDDKIIAVCERGVLVVDGAGYDSQGGGSGWTQPQRVSTIGGVITGYRSVCTGQDFAAYIATDGKAYLVGRDLSVQCASGGTEQESEITGDIVYVPPGANIGFDVATNPKLVYGTANLKVLDLGTGNMSVWTGLTALSLVGSAAGLSANVAGAPYVVSYTASGGKDLGANFSMSIRLRPQETSEDGLMTGWGRVRSVNPVFKTLANHVISVQVYADEEQVKIMDKSFSVVA